MFPSPPLRHVLKTTAKTITGYNLINKDDRIAVAVSGGKDSWVLLHLLRHFRNVGPISFEIAAVTIHPGYDGFQLGKVEEKIAGWDIPYEIVRTRIADTIETKRDEGSNPCSFCARLRRGALYRWALGNRFNKIALGHHADDAVETLFLSMIFEGRLCAMPPVLKTEKNNLFVIRPLIRNRETDIAAYFNKLDLPTADCPMAVSGSRRKEIKALIRQIERDYPVAGKNLPAALQNLNVSHFLDPKWL